MKDPFKLSYEMKVNFHINAIGFTMTTAIKLAN